MHVEYAASVAQNSLPAGTAERTGMVEVPVGLADRTAGFLTVDSYLFKSGHGVQDSPELQGRGCMTGHG